MDNESQNHLLANQPVRNTYTKCYTLSYFVVGVVGCLGLISAVTSDKFNYRYPIKLWTWLYVLFAACSMILVVLMYRATRQENYNILRKIKNARFVLWILLVILNIFGTYYILSETKTDTYLFHILILIILFDWIIIFMYIILSLVTSCCIYFCVGPVKMRKQQSRTITLIEEIAPVRLYSDYFSKYNTTCSICLDIFLPNDNVRKPNCGHIFHETCLSDWLRNNNTCPMCRVEI